MQEENINLYRKNICLLPEKYLSFAWKIFVKSAFKLFLRPVVGWCSQALHQCSIWKKKTINYKMFFYHLMDLLSNDVNDNGEKERLNRVEIKYQQVVSVQLASFLQNLNDAYKSPSTTALHCIKVPKSSCNVKCFLYLCSFLVLKIQHLFVCNLRRSNRKCAEKCNNKIFCSKKWDNTILPPTYLKSLTGFIPHCQENSASFISENSMLLKTDTSGQAILATGFLVFD